MYDVLFVYIVINTCGKYSHKNGNIKNLPRISNSVSTNSEVSTPVVCAGLNESSHAFQVLMQAYI